MRHATNPRVKPGIYLVPNARLDMPGQRTELGLGPSPSPNPPANDASADSAREQAYPLVRPKLQPAEERAAENIEVDVDFDTDPEGTAERLIEELPASGWVEPPAPAPPIAASVFYPPVAMTSPVIVTPVAPLPPAEPKAEPDWDDELTRTPRARLAHWAAFLILACVIGVGVLAFNRALTARNAAAPAETASPQPPAPTPPAPVGPSIAAALPESAAPSEANPPVGRPANPRVLPPRSASRAAAAAATAKADWTAAPPPESVEASAQASDTGLVSPPAATESGTLSINSIPISTVSVDGQPFGSTPRKVSVAPGKHSVVFRHPELGEKTVTVDVSAGGAAVAAVKF